MFGKEKPQKQPTAKEPKPKGIGSNREIMVTTYFFVFLFVGMMCYLGYFTATSEQEMMNNSYNSRQELLLSRNYRGTIYSRDGDVLAETIPGAIEKPAETDDKETGKAATDETSQRDTRVYPYKNLFAHIVGYSSQGKTGVESLGNYYLINTNTSLSNRAANDMAGRKNPGDSVYTTLDVEIQKVASEEMGIYKGAVIVTEVATGKILAMVSQPDFDPNKISEIWEDLVEDTTSTVLLNRATQGIYPPGSTFKIVTALEYIRENPDSYQNYSYDCNGSYKIGNNKISCYHGTKHGKVSFTKSFAKSCNTSFANIGMSLDRTKFAETLSQLLFHSELPMKLNHSKSSIAVSPELPDAEMMQTVIGQGRTQMTPVHLHLITAAIANKGILMSPYVLDRVENYEKDVIKSFKPESYGRLMTQEEAAALTLLMEEVVETGTGTHLSGLSYTAAGKTGSAEYNNKKGDSHAWFTGFAPAENPQVAVTIIMEGAGSGGDYAVPIAKRIFDAYFKQEKAE